VKTSENKSFLPTPTTMGWSMMAKTASNFQIGYKINGFEHVSCGTAQTK
jgi:hypothetical protein